MPSQRKQNEARKVKEEGRRESEKKKDCSVTLKPKNEILLSAHARTLQADIFCIWIKRSENVQSVNGFVVSVGSL